MNCRLKWGKANYSGLFLVAWIILEVKATFRVLSPFVKTSGSVFCLEEGLRLKFLSNSWALVCLEWLVFLIIAQII